MDRQKTIWTGAAGRSCRMLALCALLCLGFSDLGAAQPTGNPLRFGAPQESAPTATGRRDQLPAIGPGGASQTPGPSSGSAVVDPALRLASHTDPTGGEPGTPVFDRELDAALQASQRRPVTNSTGYPFLRGANASAANRGTSPTPRTFDPEVDGGPFLPLPQADAETAETSIRSAEKNSIGFQGLEMTESVKKIALNTVLVLAAAVTFLFFVKKSRQQGFAAGPRNKTAIAIEQTLSLGGKSALKLVRVGEHQVLIAMDASGVKSVVSLQDPFSAALENEALEPGKPEPLTTVRREPAEPAVSRESQSIESQLERLDPEFKKWLLAHRGN